MAAGCSFASPSLTLDHVGPQDAALPTIVFTAIAEGSTPQVARRSVIAVSPDTLGRLCAVLGQPSSGATRSPTAAVATGTFKVSASGCTSPVPALIGPDAFLELAALAAAESRAGQESSLDTLLRVARIVRAARSEPSR